MEKENIIDEYVKQMAENHAFKIDQNFWMVVKQKPKWMPSFILRWLKRKLHEDEINSIMHELKDDYELKFNANGLSKLGVNIVSVNTHHVPKT